MPCVVHLVRAANGPEPFRAFLQSWRRCPPGSEHELVLAMKGFDETDPGPYLAESADLDPKVLMLADEGLDLGTYMRVAKLLQRDRYCFLNSYSELLADGWLAKLDRALGAHDVGIVGATGSWASTRSWVSYVLGLPSSYGGLFPSRAIARQVFAEIQAERAGSAKPTKRASLESKLRVLAEVSQSVAFERFPAYHVRTNAFMIERATLSRLRLRMVRGKMDAYRLENGRESFTRQVQRLGMRALVVDRHGSVYEADQWARSRTLWQGDQEGLLVADNQTNSYARGDDQRRLVLSTFAWGRQADPGLRHPG